MMDEQAFHLSRQKQIFVRLKNRLDLSVTHINMCRVVLVDFFV